MVINDANVVSFPRKYKKHAPEIFLMHNGDKIGFTVEQFLEGVRELSGLESARAVLTVYSIPVAEPDNNASLLRVIDDKTNKKLIDVCAGENIADRFSAIINLSEFVDSTSPYLNNPSASQRAATALKTAYDNFIAATSEQLVEYNRSHRTHFGGKTANFEIKIAEKGKAGLSDAQHEALTNLFLKLETSFIETKNGLSGQIAAWPCIKAGRPATNRAGTTVSNGMLSAGIVSLDQYRKTP